MTFFDELCSAIPIPDDCEKMIARASEPAVERALSQAELRSSDFAALLSPAASRYMERMAGRAHDKTLHNYGPNILLYAPLYLSNYCVNYCVYCGFSAAHELPRRKLDLKEVEQEAQAIAATGLEHLLILTGESKQHSPVSYISECMSVLRRHFSSVSIEVYPLTEDEYGELITSGIDGLTIYQETYDPAIYAEMHPRGPKREYRFRLEAPERAAQAGIRTVNVGPLLGLAHWQAEVYAAGLHAGYLQRKFPEVEISVSLPRMRPECGGFEPRFPVSDREMVQAMLALRMFLPRVGITVSTRESAELRDNLIRLGVTKMSAGSSTEVGGYAASGRGVGQFEVSDHRSVSEMRQVIASKGYKAVLKDWHDIGPKTSRRHS